MPIATSYRNNSLIYLVFAIELPIIPTSYNFSTLAVLAANGSSAVGGCSSVTHYLDATSTCITPTSSVLMDGKIPTLTALDGDTWASQLFILHRPDFGRSSWYIYFDFSATPGYSGIRRVEVTLFNCPEWETIPYSIDVQHYTTSYRNIRRAYPTIISCNSLVTICIPFEHTTSTRLRLYFNTNSGDYVHIAEIAFYNSSSPCPPFTIISGNWTSPPPDIQSKLFHSGVINEQHNRTSYFILVGFT